MNDLQSEVQDLIIGFETRLRRIRREGERAFAEARDETGEATPEVSILPVVDGNKKSVSPESDGDKKEDKAFQEVADAILGRSGEEVADALGRAQAQNPAVHEEL